MIKMQAGVFMSWFRQLTDNESIENKIIDLKEFKEMFYKSTGRQVYFVDNKEVSLTDEQVVTYKF